MRHDEEPTIEEILESIKQVIARDNDAGADEEREHRETAGAVGDTDAKDKDVLDLAESAELAETDSSEQEKSEPGSPLLTEDAQYAMRESLAALAMLSEPGAQPQIVRSGETSLEGLVRDMLRPTLAEWLDKNLPPLVEQMVAAEIKRIASKGR